MPQHTPPLPWLQPGDSFPDCRLAWDSTTDAPGLLAAGSELSTTCLLKAYQAGIFPWFGVGQPILWWSPDPRMVLKVSEFRLRRSLQKVIKRFQSSPNSEIRFDTAFDRVIRACAQSNRRGQSGTWILPGMVEAYIQLHRLGYAHSVETWVDDQLVGGLYLVAIGKAVFGESMFSIQTDASKIAIGALICFCRANNVDVIDCQQNTGHLASLGARMIRRTDFMKHVDMSSVQPALEWTFASSMWSQLKEGIGS
ncbi:MAG: hypothetical protein RJA34_1439 [Pseudomonadota bacterium]